MRFALGFVLLLVGTSTAAIGYAALQGVGQGALGAGLLVGAAAALFGAWRLMTHTAKEAG